jgi:ATP:cob(I)alamin adenosyltransferase
MSIVTKQGDYGSTRLWSGELISKSNLRIQFCGEIDELVSYLGLAYTTTDTIINLEESKNIGKELTLIQKKLFTLASEIATLEPELSNLTNRITREDVIELNTNCTLIEKRIKLPKGFILPGSSLLSSYLDISRTICRRCERTLVKIIEKERLENTNLIPFINRLSDYLYLLARLIEKNNYRMVKT